jgi:hypothetical protein
VNVIGRGRLGSSGEGAGVWSEQRVRRACRAAVLPLVLALGVGWAALLGIGRGEAIAAGEMPRLAVAALVPQSVTPVLPEARLIGKPAPGTLFLFLFVAGIVALLAGARRRVRWPAPTGTGPAATPSPLPHTVRGRAPPRLTA